MKITPVNINRFLLFKLPAAFICGVRAKTISNERCTVTVKHRWINQNPFNSMYFAVQSMAAELSTGVLVMNHIRKSEKNISMLVASNKSIFTKKATGTITFSCENGNEIENAISNAIETKQGQTCWMKSTGRNGFGEIVSELQFEWTLKLKNT